MSVVSYVVDVNHFVARFRCTVVYYRFVDSSCRQWSVYSASGCAVVSANTEWSRGQLCYSWLALL